MLGVLGRQHVLDVDIDGNAVGLGQASGVLGVVLLGGFGGVDGVLVGSGRLLLGEGLLEVAEVDGLGVALGGVLVLHVRGELAGPLAGLVFVLLAGDVGLLPLFVGVQVVAGAGGLEVVEGRQLALVLVLGVHLNLNNILTVIINKSNPGFPYTRP